MWEKHQDSHLQKIKNSNKKSSQSYYCDCGRQILQRGPEERQAMEDTKWLWFGTTQSPPVATFPHVSAQLQAAGTSGDPGPEER